MRDLVKIGITTEPVQIAYLVTVYFTAHKLANILIRTIDNFRRISEIKVHI